MTPERSGGTLYLATETEPGTSRPRKRSGATRGPAPPSPGVRMRSGVGGVQRGVLPWKTLTPPRSRVSGSAASAWTARRSGLGGAALPPRKVSAVPRTWSEMRKGRLLDLPGSGTGRWRESVLGRGRRVIDRSGTNGRAGEAAGRDLVASWRC